MRFETAILTALIVLCIGPILRAIIGPTVWDRVLALNLLSSKIVMIIVVLAFLTSKSYLLDIAIVYALLSFVSIVMISRFVEKRGKL